MARKLCDVCSVRPATTQIRRVIPGGVKGSSTCVTSMRHRPEGDAPPSGVGARSMTSLLSFSKLREDLAESP
jgi:hypothetical protein